MNGVCRLVVEDTGQEQKIKETGITDPVNYLCGARGKGSSAKGMIKKKKKKQVSNPCFIMKKKKRLSSRVDISHKQVSPNPDSINAEQKLVYSFFFSTLFLARDIFIFLPRVCVCIVLI